MPIMNVSLQIAFSDALKERKIMFLNIYSKFFENSQRMYRTDRYKVFHQCASDDALYEPRLC